MHIHRDERYVLSIGPLHTAPISVRLTGAIFAKPELAGVNVVPLYANLADYVDGNERYVLSEGSAADCSDESKIDGTGSCESGLCERRVCAWLA